jgi:DNA polymerase-1
MNRRIQGSAARQMKIAMADCWDAGIMPILQMHDELAFSSSDPKIEKRVVEIMATAIKTNVPFQIDAEWGPTWGEAKHSYADARRLAA